jgi:hypothetical protein
MSLATITSGTAIMFQNILIRNAAATVHNIIKNSAAVMFHSTTVKHAAATVHNITILANVIIAPSITVNVAAAMFQNTIISIHANLTAAQIVVAHLLNNSALCCQMGSDVYPSDSSTSPPISQKS